MTNCRLGKFEFVFETTGKLRTLRLPNGDFPLHESEYRFDLRDGRTFVPCGWDECFPTIEPYRSSPVMGELIGVSPMLVWELDAIEQTWTRPGRHQVKRRLRLLGESAVELAFTAQDLTNTAREILWASHALFSVAGLAEVALPDGIVLSDFSVNDTVAKSFVRSGKPIVLTRRSGSIALQTDQPFWGVWLNRGGWPAGSPAHFACIGIEATNVDADQPRGATLAAGETFRGSVRLELF
jgi:hypothetical protein